jgi:hypothetical protein
MHYAIFTHTYNVARVLKECLKNQKIRTPETWALSANSVSSGEKGWGKYPSHSIFMVGTVLLNPSENT